MASRSGRHFLQIPGPSNVPDRVLRAMDRPTIDHRGPEFARLGRAVLQGCQAVFQTGGPVVIFPSSGTGAWEAAKARERAALLADQAPAADHADAPGPTVNGAADAGVVLADVPALLATGLHGVAVAGAIGDAASPAAAAQAFMQATHNQSINSL